MEAPERLAVFRFLAVVNNPEMICKIADLITAIPEAGDLVPRCKAYSYDEQCDVDITIHTEKFRPSLYPNVSENDMVYMESGGQFYINLLKHNGMMLHSSAVELNGKAYLFSGNCGAGKSTHTRLWQSTFGESARVFNDDKPALRNIDGRWIAYGTPWCGKDGININMNVPVAGICFLKQASENKIRRLGQQEAISKIIAQTVRWFKLKENLELMLSQVDSLVRTIPIFELENRPVAEAAYLSYDIMSQAAEESGL